MRHDEHLPDEQLLLDVEGELSAGAKGVVRAHLAACWKCRARRQELDQAITGFVRAYQRDFNPNVPPSAGPRAVLKARMAQSSAASPMSANRLASPRALTWAAALCSLLVVALYLIRAAGDRPAARVVSVPDAALTPGATLLVSRPAVCAQDNIKNKAVPVALQRKVFDEYGISRADPRAYEVDYLITPALGGADDIRNLWPHSYSSTVWNARVKDALEDRLRDMVCEGSIDLENAQRELAGDWIAAYKKYFHTEQPLAEHCIRCVE